MHHEPVSYIQIIDKIRELYTVDIKKEGNTEYKSVMPLLYYL